MKTVIPENLASIYDITVPHSFDVRKLRSRLDAELEKLHPCFPDRCAVDYRIRLQTYGKSTAGLHIRAVVMDRYQLADLRKRNSGRMLYIGGSHPYPVFSHDIWKKRLVFAAVLLFATAATLGTVQCASGRNREVLPVTESAEQAEASFPASMETVLLESEESVPSFESRDFSSFFKTVYEQGGSFSSLSWNGSAGVLTVHVEGLYPEQVEAAASAYESVSFGTVVYRNSVPEFDCTFPAATPGFALLDFSRSGGEIFLSLQFCDNQEPGVSAFRKLVIESGGELSSETVEPPSLSGSIPESAWPSFSSALSELLIPKLEDSFFESDLSPLFYDAPGLPFAPPAEESVEERQALSKQNEIGRITRADGSSVVYFHNKEGKIERKVFED